MSAPSPPQPDSPSQTSEVKDPLQTPDIPSQQTSGLRESQEDLQRSPRRSSETRTEQQPGISGDFEASSSAQLISSTRPRPLIVVTDPSLQGRQRENTPSSQSDSRQSRPRVLRPRSTHSATPPARQSGSPYSLPGPRSQSQARATTSAMSSASSPGNTSSTTGTSGPSGGQSGSNTSYHLPYAPFPYPNRGSGQGNQGNSGSSSGK